MSDSIRRLETELRRQGVDPLTYARAILERASDARREKEQARLATPCVCGHGRGEHYPLAGCEENGCDCKRFVDSTTRGDCARCGRDTPLGLLSEGALCPPCRSSLSGHGL